MHLREIFHHNILESISGVTEYTPEVIALGESSYRTSDSKSSSKKFIYAVGRNITCPD